MIHCPLKHRKNKVMSPILSTTQRCVTQSDFFFLGLYSLIRTACSVCLSWYMTLYVIMSKKIKFSFRTFQTNSNDNALTQTKRIYCCFQGINSDRVQNQLNALYKKTRIKTMVVRKFYLSKKNHRFRSL